ncbi:MAG: restriction endonuclease subunit S [Trichloromonadaceae bacterium]
MKWKRASLGEIFTVARGGSPRPIQDFLTGAPNGLNWIMIGDTVEGSKYIYGTKNRIRPEGLKKSRFVREGDFLLTNSMSFGRPYILKTSGCIHDGWLVLSPREGNVHPDFFYYLLGSEVLFREFSKRAAGAVVKNLNTNLVSSVEVPLPPLAEQKRIAAILDAADTLRAKRRETLAQLDTLLQSTFIEMFGDPVTNPKGWKTTRIGDCGEVITGNTPSREKPEYYGSQIEWIKSDNINDPSFMLTPAEECLSSEGMKVARVAPKGSILVTCIAGSPSCIGNAGIANRKVAFNQQINAFVPSKQILMWYAFGVFWAGKRLIQKASTNSMKGMVSKSAFCGVQIPLPPLDLQRRFAVIVESVELQKTRMCAHLEELETLFASLQHRAFNGEL